MNDSAIDHVFASTGSEALEYLEKDNFDCICFSLYMDDMDGLELSKKIRKTKNYRHTPIVLLTSKDNQEIMQDAIDAGITDIFSKDKVHELVNFIERFNQVNEPISGRVLYIEDQQSQRELVSAIFRARELEVDSFENAEDAWQAFLKNHYHLVVTDIILAGSISGVLLINKIRRLNGAKGDVPILAITAFDDTSRRISLYHMGITDYVTKPIIEEELIARIRNLIGSQQVIEKEIQFSEHLNSEETIRRTLKLEALGKLTGGIAHDYNNMLGVITGYAELLTQGLQQQPGLLHYAETIEKASQNGIKLTKKLLSFSKKDTSGAEITNINKFISESVPILEKLLTASVQLNINLDEKLWNVFIDTNDFENTLLNICINAKHAIGEKGKLTITTHNEVLSVKQAEALELPTGEFVHLTVQDSGHGMDETTLQRIFDPFFSTKGESGTGLGLSQVYGFVQRSNGAVKIKSKLNKGTIFNIYFPRQHVSEENNPAEEQTTNTQATGQNYTVLVVDDDPLLAGLTAKILKIAKFDVDIANNGNEALDRLTQKDYSAVLTDVIMPGMNGYELAEKIRASYPTIKIVLVSGYHEKEGITDNMRQSYDLILEKPVPGKKLIESIVSLLS